MKTRSVYRCSSCGHVSSKWMGKCPSCNSWETMVEEVDTRTTGTKRTRGAQRSLVGAIQPVSLHEVRSDEARRFLTGMPELDRVLGGGLVPGSVVLVGGDPGMGKSTLTLQLAAAIGRRYGTALYVTGEESLHQIKQRADRLSLPVESIVVASETNIERIAATIEQMQPQIVVIDSVQTMVTDLLESSAGSVAQVRECTALLTRIAKRSGVPMILIGHVTKDGMIAGPKVLEHMVDTVLQFEGEGTYSYRVLRALKNRYGSTNEIGVFDMQSTGLMEVPNPSEVLLSNRRADEPGTAVVAVMEGTRPLLVEVQALVSASGYSVPQRVSSGYDSKRLQLILAVLEKRGGVQVRQSDVFVNIAGGIAIQDPAIDLGVAVALASSVTDTAIPQGCAFVGELGLTGEIRRVAYLEQRIQEALRLGMSRVYVPPTDKFVSESIVSVERLSHVLTALFR